MTSDGRPAPFVRAVARRRTSPQALLLGVANHSVLIAAAIAFLAPFVFIAMTALMTNDQALSADLWPHPFRCHNFSDVFTKAPLLRWTLNTLDVLRPRELGVVALELPVAYALARLPRGAATRVHDRADRPDAAAAGLGRPALRDVGEVPPVALSGRSGRDHPNWFGDAFSIFLLRQFFLTIPEEYLDAARVDGCGELRILFTVVHRLAKPAIAAVALFSFLYTFNDFFLPLLYSARTAQLVLSIGLVQFRPPPGAVEPEMAATLLVTAPVIILFFLAPAGVRSRGSPDRGEGRRSP